MAAITLLRIDGMEGYGTCPRVVFASIITSPQNLRYWSLDGLKDFITGTCEMVTAWCEARIAENPPDKLSKKYKRFPAWAARTVKNFPQKQEHAVTYLYNLAMAGEGLGLLSGFGMSNAFKDNVKGNPEKQTLRRSEGDFF